MNQKSKHFHSEEKGCELIPFKIHLNQYPGRDLFLSCQKCLTHKKENICHCGWEFGWHCGDNSKKIQL